MSHCEQKWKFCIIFPNWNKIFERYNIGTTNRSVTAKNWRYHIFERVFELSHRISTFQAHGCVKDRVKFAISIEARTFGGKWLRFDAPWTCRITRPFAWGRGRGEKERKTRPFAARHLRARGPRSPRSMTTWKVRGEDECESRSGKNRVEEKRKEYVWFGSGRWASNSGHRARMTSNRSRALCQHTTWRRARRFSFDAK